jgi:hypothetical protein
VSVLFTGDTEYLDIRYEAAGMVEGVDIYSN